MNYAVNLLGPFEALDPTRRRISLPTRKAEALLAVLALSSRGGVPRDRILNLFWGDRAEAHARHSLSQTMSSLRASFGKDAIVADRDVIGLATAQLDVDVLQFLRAAESDEPAELQRAAALYRGALLDGLALRETAFQQWLDLERRRLATLSVDALTRLGGILARRGDDAGATRAFERALVVDPLADATHAALMRFHLDRGQVALVARHYEHCLRLYRRELDAEPPAEIDDLAKEARQRRRIGARRMGGERLSRLIHAIYEAAADPAQWEPALTLLRDHLGGTNAAITIMDTSPLKLESRVSVGIDPQYAASYTSYYASRNPIWKRAPACAPGTVLANWMVIDTAEVTKTEFYNDWVRPQGFHATLACYVLKEGAASGVVSVAREVAKGEFERSEIDAFTRTIAPHLRRATQMQVRLMRAERQHAASVEAMDRLGDGIILLSADARMLHANGAARELLREGDGLRLVRGRLHAAHNNDAVVLRRLVADAGGSNGTISGADGVLAIRRPEPRPPLTAVVVPIRVGLRSSALGQPCCAVFVTDPTWLPQSDLAALRKLYDLTPTEAAVARAVCCGHLDAASVTLGTNSSTTHTHLQRVFEKTGTRRQAELARLLLAAGPRLARSPAGSI